MDARQIIDKEVVGVTRISLVFRLVVAVAGSDVMIQCDDEQLDRDLNERFSVIAEHEVVVGHPVAHWVIRRHYVQQGREQGQCVSGKKRKLKYF